METWPEWQACQLGTPVWWSELKGVEDLKKNACKIQASFSIPEVRMRAFLEQGYTVPPAPKCLNRNAFLLDELSYHNVWQQPNHLTVAYAMGLQYWAEELNLLESPDLCPLVGSVVELRETVQEHVTFTNRDVLQGYPGDTNQWPQATLFSQVLSLLVTEQDLQRLPSTLLPPLLLM